MPKKTERERVGDGSSFLYEEKDLMMRAEMCKNTTEPMNTTERMRTTYGSLYIYNNDNNKQYVRCQLQSHQQVYFAPPFHIQTLKIE